MSQVRVPVRVLPSGKVYRQMFDAEVQLVRSLQDVKASKVDRLHLPPLTVADNETRGKIQTNLLSERQKVWMTRMPNDYVSENPVNHRYIEFILYLNMMCEKLFLFVHPDVGSFIFPHANHPKVK